MRPFLLGNTMQMMNQQDARDAAPGELELSPEDREAQAEAEQRRQDRLDAFGAALAKKRTRAVDARAQSGIQDEWIQDEEFYEGIDDANRSEHGPLTRKPLSQTGAMSIDSAEGRRTGSTLFLNITRPYVDFSAGRAADMLLPTDEMAWSIGPTPMSDVIEAMDDPAAQQQVLPGTQTPLAQAAQQMVQEIRERAERAEKRIQDWHEEGQYTAEMRKVIKDAAKVGVGILKGPIPIKRVARKIARGEDGTYKMEVVRETKPVSKRVDYWNFFPDPACGENIHNGSFVWERDDITARQIRDLMGTQGPEGGPMYLESALEAVLKEGPQRRHDGNTGYTAPDAEMFEVWYYYGVATADDLAAAGVSDVKPGSVIPVFITMINDRVIKAARSTLDSGDFPYDVMPWQPRAGHWTGIGVARQVRTPQRMVNAATRNMMDNAGIAAGPQIIFQKGIVKPTDGDYTIVPRKLWEMSGDTPIDDVRKAFAAIEIPMHEASLLAVIQFALKMAEDVTGMPMLMQGQQGRAAETVGGMQMLTNNSNTPMRTIAKQFDDYITCPHLGRYYEFLLMYGPSDDEKGDFQVSARGSSALFERDAQNQAIMAMAPFVQDTAFKIDPAKWIEQWLKAQRLTASNFQYSDDEWKQLQEQMQQNQPADPRIEATKISAEASIEREKIKAAVTEKRIEVDTDRDTAYLQAENDRTQLEHQARQRELDQKERIAMLQYATQERITLDQAKADLAKTAMQLRTQKELAGMGDSATGPQVATPPTEPPGRADDGQAYQE